MITSAVLAYCVRVALASIAEAMRPTARIASSRSGTRVPAAAAASSSAPSALAFNASKLFSGGCS